VITVPHHRNRICLKGELASPPRGMFRGIVRSSEGQIHVRDGNVGQACEVVILSCQETGSLGVVVDEDGEVLLMEPH